MASKIKLNKPKWDDAPRWAEYLAMDSNGDWWWYEDEPVRNGGSWISSGGGDVEKCKRDINLWKKTVERRPLPKGALSETKKT